MGVLNVTPDSFSDGGNYLPLDQALLRAAKMHEEGADIIDIGGESTRPGSEETPLQEELDRVVPVVECLSRRLDVAVSVDSSKPEVMEQAVRAGAVMINDVFALRKEGALKMAAGLDAAVCLMHMQGSPESMQQAPVYGELPGDVIRFLAERVEICSAAGIEKERMLVDPGFGFGKNDAHNLKLLANLDQFAELELPLLVGLSRKQWLGNLTGKPVGERVSAGIAAALAAIDRGANIVRTHDVASTVDAFKVAEAIKQAGRGK
jgi:dihydropteroate synthase